MENKIVINGQEFALSSLRCKHLRQISQILQDITSAPPKGVFSEVEKWMPFIAESIKVKTPDFNSALLDELTLQEFTDTWNNVVALSGITVVPKANTQSSTETTETTPPIVM